ncbi:MAG: RNA 2',3'-cyclic phosphodiesterase [Gammaproteobacteria bacterium]
MRRLFLALWPDAATRKHLQRISADLPISLRQRVSVENLHVTLVFLGGVEDELLPAITQPMAAIQAAPFSLRFDQLSYWRKPRILCLTCSRIDATVLKLVADISAPLAALHLDIDTRPYNPHITLARHVTAKPETAFEPLLWRAEGFALVESVSTRSGVVYQPLHMWRF